MQLAMAENSRYLVYAMGAAASLYFIALIIVLRYRQNALKLAPRLTRRQRWKLNLQMFFAKVFTKGMLYWFAVWLCFGTVFSPFSYLYFESRTEIGWLLALFILALIGLLTGLRLIAVAKSHDTLSLASIGHIDARQPILLLRSFADDMTPILRNDGQGAMVRRLLAPTLWTLEETLEKQLTSYGPLIAIGRPGENMPPAGAAREYVLNEEWRQRVKQLIKQARVVVIILGDTPGLKFEYEALKQLDALPKVIAIFPPTLGERLEISWKYFFCIFWRS
ncbi:hypothetical protein SAMN05216326_1902 [Nitrosomonas marina]|uniref:Uncharacterized protein n=1 Tax=Nitrosomonas marina TaxID=917 RepID=A0A1I0GNK9_9PROT|nr:hypothetical protein [Nitrosomonas marina]SET71735.1 hypothetical protein SAMN05216326_1902 [Nitrosomonas marina]